MILVADSGSSKTDWLLSAPGQENKAFKSAGLNPYFLTEKEITKIIQEQVPDMVALAADITEIYFFGAGCSSPDRHEIVSNAISSLIPNAYVSVDSDLLASAYATCGQEKGFCCVLGTGSNISFFDGEDIHDGQHGLGYALGDEGSGTWFGKALVTDYLYGNMPDEINAKFKAAYNLQKEEVIINTYQKQRPNSYLASFSKFLTEIRASEYGQELLRKGLLEFVDTNIKSYPQFNKFKCHFVGSIAYVFADELKAVCEENDVHIGKIIRQPIADLMEFILKRG
ncbi:MULTISPECIES: N-acetylglucosamine kinase [unclassified Mucilaginibacter]|uniref:N-acetylglucosamine kinase n=1 Tax=unclassified Mucilaginibacter TaxID=2617802 RepID=UPI002AC928C7|nr:MULTISPECIES: N-acetylglucosamine kinase [unclassified Mucilaginibacter]MEB0249883.1 N-acetylglucosamine kinase [Mucilaginibacter sp. 5B2]MEB0261628.1 N-acetylglucosamine kinase [Mucilaginibacter sp. 10I4]MEB0278492.1 N-acetylglucosamine kinase [Mucilaginibacter sp. 10B2]MEB0300712.1 N-acetylglucosamine kinase [Mucilaginibacter sp. 5C4]WPX23551.1 N-acetylglucosamine kinase [Mucilaginibacter sp. 5C4]